MKTYVLLLPPPFPALIQDLDQEFNSLGHTVEMQACIIKGKGRAAVAAVPSSCRSPPHHKGKGSAPPAKPPPRQRRVQCLIPPPLSPFIGS